MKKTVWGLLLAAASVVAMAPLPAMADRGGYDRGHSHSHGHGHYGRHSEREWRGGSWHHGSYSGRSGWWWIVNGVWYPYSHRSNTYPVYQETVVIEQPVQQQPQTIIVQQPVQQPTQQLPQMQQQYPQQYPQTSTLPPPGIQQPTANMWYYCDASRMYYPYVQNCTSGWRAVSPVPPTGVIR